MSGPIEYYSDSRPTGQTRYLWPVLKGLIASRQWPDRRVFDLGCGNGATCGMLHSLGFDAVGIDISPTGIAQARAAFPGVRAEVANIYDDLAASYGTFPLVVSLDVIEHCVQPRAFARTFLSLIAPDGIGFLATPYHGYLKNLALALSGKMDHHFQVLSDCGHIKFFSIATLSELLHECGARDVGFMRAGRIPPLAKSMIAIVGNPSSQSRRD
jgi:2-polyprenyl-6-hydroxyphenyl methylase/3-demethylubiquinone-9 3-methyltransferase